MLLKVKRRVIGDEPTDTHRIRALQRKLYLKAKAEST
jgi:hypothetical protein